MLKHSLLIAALLASGLAQAQAPDSKAQYASETRQAKSRYQQDLKLCADEPDSAARMQCKRDAKAGHDQALVEAKARLAAAGSAAAAATKPPASACADCGRVTEVRHSEKPGEGGALGMIAGGAAGALLGHQVGEGIGKDLATIAGAAGGAYAGKQIEKRVKAQAVWTVTVEFPGGALSSYEFDHDPGFKAGDPVRKSDATIVSR